MARQTEYRRTERTIVRPAPFRFPPSYRLTGGVRDALRAIERADQDIARFDIDDARAHELLREALTRNAYGTASIEGNPLTVEEVESLLVRNPRVEDVKEPDEREILNYAALIRRIAAVRPPHDVAEVQALHRDLFHGVLATRGALKTEPNFIGRKETHEIVYVPTSPRFARKELARALDWLREGDEHPLVRAMVFFHEFQSIHPFPDGNGRLGRAITTLFLWHAGYRGVSYALVDWGFNRDREAYYKALDEARQGNWDLTPWLGHMAAVLRSAFEEAVRRFLFRSHLPPALNPRQAAVAEWFARLAAGGGPAWAKLNDVHERFPAVPRRTLQMDLALLVEAGVLAREGDRKAARYRLAGATRGR